MTAETTRPDFRKMARDEATVNAARRTSHADLRRLMAVCYEDAFLAGVTAGLEAAEKSAQGWLDEYAGFAPQFVSANKYANDAVRDIVDVIRSLKPSDPSHG